MNMERMRQTLQVDHLFDVRLFEIGGTSVTDVDPDKPCAHVE